MVCILRRLLLLCSSLLGHIPLSGGNTLYGRQQDPVEGHWYNTRDSVFELHSVAQLRGFAELVISGIDFHKQEVRLANDIFFNDTTGQKAREQNPRSEEHTSELQSREQLAC